MSNFKKFFTGLTVIASIYGASAFAAEHGAVRSIVNVNSVTIPSGFDNSTPTAVISGLFPNSCYSYDKSEVKNVDTLTHEIRTYATITQGMCLMVIIPFSEEVSLGKLESGDHTLRFVNGDGTYLEKKLSIQ